jgi:hypothetical protein
MFSKIHTSVLALERYSGEYIPSIYHGIQYLKTLEKQQNIFSIRVKVRIVFFEFTRNKTQLHVSCFQVLNYNLSTIYQGFKA